MAIFVMIPGLPQSRIQCFAISVAMVCIHVEHKEKQLFEEKMGNLTKVLKNTYFSTLLPAADLIDLSMCR